MYELKYRGLWFRWHSFDAQSRRLASISMICGAASGGFAGLAAKPYNDRWGFDLTAYNGPLIAMTLITAILAATFWTLFSRRQDELFNRAQNWAMGMAGAWTCIATGLWWAIAEAHIAPAMPTGALILSFLVLMTSFWLLAIRRWAS